MKPEDAAANKIELNYNDPDVYTDPAKVALLPPRERMLAILNMAKTGQIVNGDEVLTLEAMLANAGYQMTLDGHLSGEEMAALKNFQERLEDKQFKEAAVELIAMMAGVAAVEELVLPTFGAPAAHEAGLQQNRNPAQSAAAKVVLGLTPFSDDF